MSENVFDTMTDEMKKFLVSSYFGEIKGDNLTLVCVERAYLDLSRRVPYRWSVSELEKMKKENEKGKEFADNFEKQKNDFKKRMINKLIELVELENNDVRKMIYDIFDEANRFEIWKDGELFYYGLAQKWVNMTFKYLWLFNKCKVVEEKLDVPIDSYIIHAAISKETGEQPYGLELRIDGVNKNTPWSTMDDTLYERIQESIKEGVKARGFGLSVIQWENKAWIAQAKLEV